MITTGHLFYIDNLSILMMSLVGFIAICVGSFSIRYLNGDRKQKSFYINLLLMVFAILIMVCADNIILLFISWVASNIILTRLMLHKTEWIAAKNSSRLALNNFKLGAILLGCSLILLCYASGETSIQKILKVIDNSMIYSISALLMLLTAMTQSALWPFHRWLTSSLNSPTPVSAIMHAGLVNGSGFILTRFAPLYLDSSLILNIMFIAGISSAIIGTIWKLIQSDIKRMLACSTMGQMGFMVAQCGLGLFSAAIAHLVCHGLFKAYLFLASGSAAKVKRKDHYSTPTFINFCIALGCGLVGTYMFSSISDISLYTYDTTIFLKIMALILCTQFSLTVIQEKSSFKIAFGLIIAMVIGSTYGLSVYLIETLLNSLNIFIPLKLNPLHITAIVIQVLAWLSITFYKPNRNGSIPNWMLKAYVKMLNASQPHPNTITTLRNQYKY